MAHGSSANTANTANTAGPAIIEAKPITNPDQGVSLPMPNEIKPADVEALKALVRTVA